MAVIKFALLFPCRRGTNLKLIVDRKERQATNSMVSGTVAVAFELRKRQRTNCRVVPLNKDHVQRVQPPEHQGRHCSLTI